MTWNIHERRGFVKVENCHKGTNAMQTITFSFFWLISAVSATPSYNAKMRRLIIIIIIIINLINVFYAVARVNPLLPELAMKGRLKYFSSIYHIIRVTYRSTLICLLMGPITSSHVGVALTFLRAIKPPLLKVSTTFTI